MELTNDTVPVQVSTLDVRNMDVAHAKYGEFVDVRHDPLTQSEFKDARQLPLNEEFASVFFHKVSHLEDRDFIEIDRIILETIGFKNCFVQQKDKHGNVKLDEYGNVKLTDARTDFSSAIRCLRNTAGFVEGTSVDDVHAHFVIQKAAKLDGLAGGAGKNKQSLWVRMRALEHFVIMANTKNSFQIREYFLDLKNIMTEYNMYLAVYHSMKKIESVQTQNEDIQQVLDDVMNTVTSVEDKVVLPAQDPHVHELMVLMYSVTNDKYMVLRTQERNKKAAMKQCRRTNGVDFDEVFCLISYQNPRNLFHRFKDHVRTHAQNSGTTFFHTSFQTSLHLDDIKSILLSLEQSFQNQLPTTI